MKQHISNRLNYFDPKDYMPPIHFEVIH